jgi:hypothetical protein
MASMLWLEEVRRLRKSFAASDVPSARPGSWGMTKNFDRLESRRGRRKAYLVIWWRAYKCSAVPTVEHLCASSIFKQFIDLTQAETSVGPSAIQGYTR